MAPHEVLPQSEKEAMSISTQAQESNEHLTSPEQITQEVYATWDAVLQNPDAHLTQYQALDKEGQPIGEIAFVAGGELLSQVFGPNVKPEISQKVAAALEAGNGTLTIAGITFTQEQLQLLGSFYTHLQEHKQYKLHCIDERLVDDVQASEQQSHESCGACAATAAALGLEATELLNMVNTDPDKKLQAIDPTLAHHHSSMSILVDFHGRDVLIEEQRSEFRDKNALPFNISLPVIEIAEFIRTNQLDVTAKEQLITALLLWNPGLARKIIGGDHNTLQTVSENTQIIVDERSIPDGEGMELATQFKDSLALLVPHGRLISLGNVA